MYACKCGTVYVNKNNRLCYDSIPCDYCLRCGEKLPKHPEYEDGYYIVEQGQTRTICEKWGSFWYFTACREHANASGHISPEPEWTIIRKIDMED